MLFHVTADTTWSNLPLSGLFVEMMRRIVAEASAAAPKAGAPTPAKVVAAALAHARRVRRPASRRRPPPSRCRRHFPAPPTPSIRPGFYGAAGQRVRGQRARRGRDARRPPTTRVCERAPDGLTIGAAARPEALAAAAGASRLPGRCRASLRLGGRPFAGACAGPRRWRSRCCSWRRRRRAARPTSPTSRPRPRHGSPMS